MLKIFKAPEAFSLGLEDRFNAKMQLHLNATGVPCIVKDIWPNFLAKYLFFKNLPYTYKVYLKLVAPFYCLMHLQTISGNDLVWINGASLPIVDTKCWFEKKIIKRGASYIFWLEDDYFSDPHLKSTAEARMDMADLIVAVTPTLRDRISKLYPGKKVIVLEEPIDIQRLSTIKRPLNLRKPIVLGGGRPWSIEKMTCLNDVLERIYRDIPFTLRIITGSKKPEIKFSIPWEWLPYDRSKEADYAAGAVAGLAPLEDNPYNRCKGNYKVKTYMALGIPPLTSPIGYNNDLIKNGENGFLLKDEYEWESVLRKLLKDSALVSRIGSSARDEVIRRYSYSALMPIWADELEQAFPTKAKRTLISYSAQTLDILRQETLSYKKGLNS